MAWRSREADACTWVQNVLTRSRSGNMRCIATYATMVDVLRMRRPRISRRLFVATIPWVTTSVALLQDGASVAAAATMEETQTYQAKWQNQQPPNLNVERLDEMDLECILQTPLGELLAGAGSLASPRPSKLVPAVVEVITAKDIERLGLADLRELLLSVGGTYEQDLPTFPMYAGVVKMRGGPSSNRFLLVMDDSVVMPMIEEFIEPYTVPINAIERIELLRGPAASLYGSSAMAGVLRVVTKPARGNGADVQVLADPVGKGYDARVSGYMVGRLAGNDAGLRFDAQSRRTQKMRVHIHYSDSDVLEVHPRAVASTAVMLGGHIGALNGQARYVLQQGTTHGLDGTPFSEVKPMSSRADVVDVKIAYSRTSGNLRVSASLLGSWRSRATNMGRFPAGFGAETAMETTEAVVNASTMASYEEAAWGVAAGIQYRYLTLLGQRSTLVDGGVRNPIGLSPNLTTHAHDANVLCEGHLDIVPGLQAVAGGRLNLYRPVGQGLETLTPKESSLDPLLVPMGRAALVWQADAALVFKAIYGRSFRHPAAIELFAEVPGVISPNTGLVSEIQDSWELVADATAGTVSGRINVHFNRLYNVIINRGGLPQQYVNADTPVVTTGVESTVDWNLDHSLSLRAQASWQNGWAEDRASIAGLPTWIGRFRVITKPVADVPVELSGLIKWNGPSDIVEGSVNADITALWRPWPALMVTISGHNLFTGRSPMPFSGVAEPAMMRDMRAVRVGVSSSW